MAKINLKEAVKVGVVPPNFNDRVTLRVVDAEFTAESKSSGKPNIKLRTEIIRPQEIEQEGVKYDLTSIPIDFYFTFDEKGLGRIRTFHETMDLPLDEFDTENPDVSLYKGLVFELVMNTKEDFKRIRDPKNPTKFKPMFEADGKTMISLGWTFNTFMDATLRRSTEEVNRPY